MLAMASTEHQRIFIKMDFTMTFQTFIATLEETGSQSYMALAITTSLLTRMGVSGMVPTSCMEVTLRCCEQVRYEVQKKHQHNFQVHLEYDRMEIHGLQ